MSNTKYWINRYPICAMVYKEAAELLGYDEDEAKSLGLARATFFARAKFGGFASPSGRRPGKKATTAGVEHGHQSLDNTDELIFAGLSAYIVETESGIRAIFGEKIQTPEDYNKRVLNKIVMKGGRAGYEKLRKYIISKLKEYDTITLNTNIVYKVYESLRDEVREEEFLKSTHININANG